MDNTTELTQKLDALIRESDRILVTCHTSPDPDALASLIAMKHILTEHYQKVTVTAIAERIPTSLAFIPGYGTVEHGSPFSKMEDMSYDLVILLDFNQWHMISKEDAQHMQDYTESHEIPVVVIDHHPKENLNIKTRLYLNIDPTSTASNLHFIFHKNLGFDITTHIADHLLLGIIADTNRFKYRYGAEKQSTIVHATADLLDFATTDIERLSQDMERFSLPMLKIVNMFINNVTVPEDTLAYTFLTAQEVEEIPNGPGLLGDASQYIANNVITAVEQVRRGFLVYPHLAAPDTYTIRFRSRSPEYPVDAWAMELGGGGHVQSAAARITGTSIEDAIEKILKVTQI